MRVRCVSGTEFMSMSRIGGYVCPLHSLVVGVDLKGGRPGLVLLFLPF
jgi:hypothetical protein